MWCATTRGVLCCSHMFLRNTRAVLGALLQYSHQTSAEAAIEELKVVQRCSSFGAAPDRYTRNRISHPQGVQSWMEVPEIPGSRSAFWRELVLSRITKISTNQTITDYPLHPLSILLWEVGSGVTFIDVLVYSPRVIEFIPHSTRNTQDFCGETRRLSFLEHLVNSTKIINLMRWSYRLNLTTVTLVLNPTHQCCDVEFTHDINTTHIPYQTDSVFDTQMYVIVLFIDFPLITDHSRRPWE